MYDHLCLSMYLQFAVVLTAHCRCVWLLQCCREDAQAGRMLFGRKCVQQ